MEKSAQWVVPAPCACYKRNCVHRMREPTVPGWSAVNY